MIRLCYFSRRSVLRPKVRHLFLNLFRHWELIALRALLSNRWSPRIRKFLFYSSENFFHGVYSYSTATEKRFPLLARQFLLRSEGRLPSLIKSVVIFDVGLYNVLFRAFAFRVVVIVVLLGTFIEIQTVIKLFGQIRPI